MALINKKFNYHRLVESLNEESSEARKLHICRYETWKNFEILFENRDFFVGLDIFDQDVPICPYRLFFLKIDILI